MAHRNVPGRTDATTVLVMGDTRTSIGFTQGELKTLNSTLKTIILANMATINAVLPSRLAREMSDRQKFSLIFNYMRPNRLG